jgi:hypothetical protein
LLYIVEMVVLLLLSIVVVVVVSCFVGCKFRSCCRRSQCSIQARSLGQGTFRRLGTVTRSFVIRRTMAIGSMMIPVLVHVHGIPSGTSITASLAVAISLWERSSQNRQGNPFVVAKIIGSTRRRTRTGSTRNRQTHIVVFQDVCSGTRCRYAIPISISIILTTTTSTILVRIRIRIRIRIRTCIRTTRNSSTIPMMRTKRRPVLQLSLQLLVSFPQSSQRIFDFGPHRLGLSQYAGRRRSRVT